MAGINSNTIQDYMKSMADTANHERILINSELKRGIEKTNNVDFLKLEYSILSVVEREILGSLEMEEQWQMKQQSLKMDLSVTTIADSGQGRQLNKTKVVEVDFANHGLSCNLEPLKAYAYDQDRERVGFAYDSVRMGRAASVFHNSSAEITGGLSMNTTQTRLGLKPEMRHVFSKLYLLLQDYNLAETANFKNMEVDPGLSFPVNNRVTVEQRMMLINETNIVVDSHGFTREELGVLTLGAAPYPSVWYAGDNVYNSIEMPADSLAICSTNVVDIDTRVTFGSPGALYRLICSLACKLGCVQDMMDAFQSMRGKAFLLHSLINPEDPDGMCITNDIPLSISYTCSTGEVANIWDVMEVEGGYFSWSKALLAEGILGHAYTNTASNLVEEIGGYGKMFGSATPSSSKTLNGFLRDHGLNHGDHRINSLLLNWGAIAGRPLSWGFHLRVKEYVVRLCGLAKGTWDVAMPQLQLFNIVNNYKYTSWGRIRNWTGAPLTPFTKKEEKKKKMEETICFTWAMGMRDRRPMLFANQKGESSLYLHPEEQVFLSAQQGQNFRINSIGIGLLGSRSGRIDEVEQVAKDFHTSHVIHAGDYIVYNHDSGWGRPEAVDESEFKDLEKIRQSMRGERAGVTEPEESIDGLENDLYMGFPAMPADDPVKTADLVTGRGERTPTDMLYVTSWAPKDVGRTVRTDQDGNPRVVEHEFGNEISNRPVSLDYLKEVDGKMVDMSKLGEKFDDAGAVPAMLQAMVVMGMLEADEYERGGAFAKAGQGTQISDPGEIGAIGDELGVDVRLVSKSSDGIGLIETKLGKSAGPIVRLNREGSRFNAVFLKEGSQHRVTKQDLPDRNAELLKGRRKLRDSSYGKPRVRAPIRSGLA